MVFTPASNPVSAHLTLISALFGRTDWWLKSRLWHRRGRNDDWRWWWSRRRDEDRSRWRRQRCANNRYERLCDRRLHLAAKAVHKAYRSHVNVATVANAVFDAVAL